MSDKINELSVAPYRGVRDFYPDDCAVQKYIFETMRSVAESFGYVEYSASILEPAELYRAKSGDEIANEQMYVFTDKGGREVALRPEMTPSLARMVAAKRRELSFPLRWYSIPNLFRYERPQRGRLREHWQLNVDMFGSLSVEADAEIIVIAHSILKKFGLTDKQFEIRVSNREFLADIIAQIGLPEDKKSTVFRTIDARPKISPGEYEDRMKEAVGDEALASELLKAIAGTNSVTRDAAHPSTLLRDALAARNLSNVIFDVNIVRGLDYYTGMVFEVFDTDPQNNRALFGGGRYDHLLDIFGGGDIPAVGFGMGDVTIRDTLETYRLIPDSMRHPAPRVSLSVSLAENLPAAHDLADFLREHGIATVLDFTESAIGDHYKKAEKNGIPYAIHVDNESVAAHLFTLRTLATRDDRALSPEDSASFLASHP